MSASSTKQDTGAKCGRPDCQRASKIRLPASIICGSRDYPCTITELAEERAEVVSQYHFGHGEKISIEATLPPKGQIAANGIVERCGQVNEGSVNQFKINLNWDRLSFADFTALREYLGPSSEQRVAQRRPADLPAHVRYPLNYKNLFVRNVSTGGFFLAIDKPMKEGTFMRVNISLPQREVMVDGCVSHQISPETAKQLGNEAGVGVHILQIPRSDSDLWNNFVNSPAQGTPKPKTI